MEFFGLTYYGNSDPIKTYMRPDYKEPRTPPNILKLLEEDTLNIPITDLREVDLYNGILDGFAYSSVHRIKVTRKKGFYKPVGPYDMYNDRVTTSMDIGWWLFDPKLKDETWYKTDSYHPQQISEKSRFLNKLLLKIPNFVL